MARHGEASKLGRYGHVDVFRAGHLWSTRNLVPNGQSMMKLWELDVKWRNCGEGSKLFPRSRPHASTKTHRFDNFSCQRSLDDTVQISSRFDEFPRRSSSKYNACKWPFRRRSIQNGGLPVGLEVCVQEAFLSGFTWYMCVKNFVHLRRSTRWGCTFERC